MYNEHMSSIRDSINKKQLIFREMVFGTLVYSVVLGFFNDYTAILDTKSYSTTFFVAIVLQVLTYLTVLLKKRIAGIFKQKTGRWAKVGLVMSVWLILFFSKFVFLAVLSFIFKESIEISGFVGLMAIIVTMTIAKEALDYTFNKLLDE